MQHLVISVCVCMCVFVSVCDKTRAVCLKKVHVVQNGKHSHPNKLCNIKETLTIILEGNDLCKDQ